MPVLEGVDGRSALEDGLREVAVVEPDVAQDRLLEVLVGVEAVALPYRCGALIVSRVSVTIRLER